MDLETLDQERERVLLAGPVTTDAHRTVQRVVASGGEAILVTSAAEARRASGAFDHAVFAFDLPDGSGIVLAAEMMLENRVHNIGFLHPDDDRETTAPDSDDSSVP
jgi:hypothetical protein